VATFHQHKVAQLVAEAIQHLVLVIMGQELELELAQEQIVRHILRQIQNLAAPQVVVLGAAGLHQPLEFKKGQELVLEQIVLHTLNQKLDAPLEQVLHADPAVGKPLLDELAQLQP
jgi:hypothetical protein